MDNVRFAPFIPTAAQRLEDKDAIALLHRLHRRPVVVPGLSSIEAHNTVATAIVAPEAGAIAADTPAPVLMLHGFDSSLLEFRHLIPLLPPHWPIYAVDLLGAGFTACPQSVPVEPRTIRQHLYGTWKTLFNRPIMLTGASLGGAVAMDFALHHPDCVERLILIDSVGFSGNFPVGKRLWAPLIDWGADWLQLRKDVAFHTLEAFPFSSSTQKDLVLCSALHQSMPGWKQAVKSFTRSGGYTYLSKQISSIQQPTLIIWGERDASLGTEDARKFKQAISHSRLVWIQDAGHAPHLDQPLAVAEAILKELRRPSTAVRSPSVQNSDAPRCE